MSSGRSPRWPDFYIVGAPRCGTTFLWKALRRHPDVFMPPIKEPLFFCSDLDTGTAGDRRHFYRQGDYLALFKDAPQSSLVGEACIMNLFSTMAARRIHAVRSDAQIIINLREPVAQIVSFHASRVASGAEDLRLADALNAEQDRAAGRRLPGAARMVPAYQYRAVARYGEQIERYLNLFPRDQILFNSFDDLEADPRSVVDAVFRFLGKQPPPVVPTEVVQAQRGVRWPALARVVRSPRLTVATERIAPAGLRSQTVRAIETIARLNLKPIARPIVDPALLSRLREEMRPSVEEVQRLVGAHMTQTWAA